MTYRVIGPDGIEREIGPMVSEWATAIQSGHADGHCLFWDSRAQRWSHVSTLEVYKEARNQAPASGEPSYAPEDPPSFLTSGVSAPSANSSRAHPSEAPDLSHQAVGKESTPELGHGRPAKRRRPGRSSVSVLVVAACVTVALALAYGDTERLMAAVDRFSRQVPWQACAVAALLIGLIALEEFHWLALRLLGIGHSGFLARIGVQGLALLCVALVLYGVSRGQSYFDRGDAGANQNFGLRLDFSFPERVFASLSAGELKAAVSLMFVQHSVFMAIVYGCAVFIFTVVLLPRIGLLRSAFGSTLVSALIFGTLYMAVFPLTTPDTRNPTDTRNPSDTRTTGAPPELAGQAAIRVACSVDIEKLCAGEQRVGQCLRGHQEKLSDSCKAVLAKARANRPGTR